VGAKRTVLIVVGSLLALIGLALAAGGGALLWAHQTQRDDDGFFRTSTVPFRSATGVIASEDLDLALRRPRPRPLTDGAARHRPPEQRQRRRPRRRSRALA
jgi:hypothetical protein